MCPQCRAFITTDDRTCPYCNESVAPRAVDSRNPAPILGGLVPNVGFVTFMALLINVGLYVCTAILSSRSGNGDAMNIDGQTLFALGAKYNPALAAGQLWRLVTAGFLHGGIIHLLMNSWCLFTLGAQVEDAYGISRMIVIYFASTVLGFYASAIWSASLSIGASAAIFGLIGCMIAIGLKEPRRFGGQTGQYVRWALLGVVYFFLPSLHVDNAAHVGGFVAGFVVGYLAGSPRVTGGAEGFWKVAAVLCLGLTAWSFLKMFLWFTGVTGG